MIVELMRRNDVVKSGLILALSWGIYSTVRALTSESVDIARENAELVRSLQDRLGIGVEAAVQGALLDENVALIANSYYLLHFPLTVVVLGVVFLRERSTVFPIVRDGLVVMTLAGLAVHLVFPLAPPRMLEGIIDATTMHGPNPYELPGSGAANQFAAMPSMHVAWAIVAGWVLIRLTTSKRYWVLGAVHPLATMFVVVVTGHHFVLDAAVGLLLAVVALAAAAYLHRTGRNPGDNNAVVHSPSTAKLARNSAISPSYPLVSHKPVLAPLTVCQHTPNRTLSHPISKVKVCNPP